MRKIKDVIGVIRKLVFEEITLKDTEDTFRKRKPPVQRPRVRKAWLLGENKEGGGSGQGAGEGDHSA